jgi:NADH:ubiquinone reductase (H+-translocating)
MRKRILIVGGGFGGAYCAQALERNLREEEAEVILLDKNNYFIFYPLLVEAGTGSLEPRHAVVPLRNFLRSTRFRMARVEEMDTEARHVVSRLGDGTREVTSYDHLVLAAGSVTSWPDVPGLRKRGYRMKTLSDAVVLRDRAIQVLELADASRDAARRKALLNFLVVGGNYTGVEVAGEFQVFLRQASRAYPGIQPRDCNVTLVEISDRILPALDPDLSNYALDRLRRRGIEVLLNTSITEVRPDSVVLKGGGTIPTSTVIWCAGIAPDPLIGRLPLPLDPRGYILCDRDLRVSGFQNVWAIGDCAVNPDKTGKPYPATAQHAVRQGVHLAGNLARVQWGEPSIPCDIDPTGSLAPLGCRTAVAKVYGMKLSGFPAWFLWRTVYLSKMPGLSRKLRVALDWTLDLFFQRSYVQLGVHRPVETDSHQ